MSDGKLELDANTAIISGEIRNLTTDQQAAFDQLKSGVNMDKSVLLVGAVQNALPGQSIDWPITIIPGKFAPTALQFDITVPPGFSVVAVSPGAAATKANKSVTGAFTSAGTERVVLFGLNQTRIGQGVAVVVRLQIATTTVARIYPLTLSGPVVSDGGGFPIVTSVVSGSVVIQ